MNTKEIEMKKMLIQMGVSPDLRGYHYLAEAITMQRESLENSGELIPFYSGIYEGIAKAHNKSAYMVERDMRFAVEKAFDHYNEELLALFRALIKRDSGKVTLSCFISTMAEYFAFQKGEGKDEEK